MENQNLEKNVKVEKNTDPKPHICYFNGNFEKIVPIFFQKIKPMEGIVKYKMVAWEKFPTSVEEAKKMALEWVKKFQLSNTYSEFNVGIYFHLTSKTIRFELKQKKLSSELSSELSSKLSIKLNVDEVVEDYILSYNYNQGKTFVFDCSDTKYLTDFDLTMCKLKAKELALGLESKYVNNKFIVFLNPSSNTIQIQYK